MELSIHVGYIVKYACLDLQIGKILTAVAPRNAAKLYEILHKYDRIPKFTFRKLNGRFVIPDELKLMWKQTPDDRKEDPEEVSSILRMVLLRAESERNHMSNESVVSIHPLLDLEKDGVLCDECEDI